MKYGLALIVVLAGALLVLFLVRPAPAQSPSVTMLWTAPPGTLPGATYQMRYSRTPVGIDTMAWWVGGNVVGNLPAPGLSGSMDSVGVPLGAWATNYYFVARTCNGLMCSGWSNVATYTTPASPPGRIQDLRPR